MEESEVWRMGGNLSLPSRGPPSFSASTLASPPHSSSYTRLRILNHPLAAMSNPPSSPSRGSKNAPPPTAPNPAPRQAPQSHLHPTTSRRPLAAADRAEVYRRRVTRNVRPAGWQNVANLTGALLAAASCGYLLLWADFGDREHIFSPVS